MHKLQVTIVIVLLGLASALHVPSQKRNPKVLDRKTGIDWAYASSFEHAIDMIFDARDDWTVPPEVEPPQDVGTALCKCFSGSHVTITGDSLMRMLHAAFTETALMDTSFCSNKQSNNSFCAGSSKYLHWGRKCNILAHSTMVCHETPQTVCGGSTTVSYVDTELFNHQGRLARHLQSINKSDNDYTFVHMMAHEQHLRLDTGVNASWYAGRVQAMAKAISPLTDNFIWMGMHKRGTVNPPYSFSQNNAQNMKLNLAAQESLAAAGVDAKYVDVWDTTSATNVNEWPDGLHCTYSANVEKLRRMVAAACPLG